jgi:DNA-binding response OmpR family regulator
VGDLLLNPATREVVVEGRTAQLTPTEFDLLRYLMHQAGRIVSVDELLQNVWGYPPNTGDPDLVRAHIHNLRHKIEPDPSKPTYIKTVPRHGYIVPASEGNWR